MIYLQVNKGIEVINIEEYNIKKPSVCNVLNLYLTDNIYKNSSKVELFKTPLGVFTKIEYK